MMASAGKYFSTSSSALRGERLLLRVGSTQHVAGCAGSLKLLQIPGYVGSERKELSEADRVFHTCYRETATCSKALIWRCQHSASGSTLVSPSSLQSRGTRDGLAARPHALSQPSQPPPLQPLAWECCHPLWFPLSPAGCWDAVCIVSLP